MDEHGNVFLVDPNHFGADDDDQDDYD
jgi:hypothetical protein